MKIPALLIVVATLALLAGCGGRPPGDVNSPDVGSDSGSGNALGFPLTATKNTTRIGSSDAATNAAAAALAVFPSQTDGDHPKVAVLVDKENWAAAAAAAVLSHGPLTAPILLTDGGDVPEVTSSALKTLKPSGSPKIQGAQVVRIGSAPAPSFVHGVVVAGGSPIDQAAAIDAFSTTAAGKPSPNVMIASADQPALAIPAAALAAKSGASLLFVNRDQVPQATEAAIARHGKPAIFVLGPRNNLSQPVIKRLRTLGSSVTSVGALDPVVNAVEFARFKQGSFGWGTIDPGHGLVFVNASRPIDASYAALLSNSGSYGPLLLVNQPSVLPKADRDFLLDIQPGYQQDPSRGVYNRAWIVGSTAEVSGAVQAKIDSLLDIQRIVPTPIPKPQNPPTTPTTGTTTNSSSTTTQPTTTTTTTTNPGTPTQRKP